jgi:signal transduction histidine kinase
MDGSDSDRPRRSLSHADNRLVRLVGRVPITVQRKLLLAFGIVVLLLGTVGVLGIGVLNQSNNRVETLGVLPHRVATYTRLQDDSMQLSQQLSDRSALLVQCSYGVGCATIPGQCPGDQGCPGPPFHPDSTLVAAADGAIEAILFRIGSSSDLATLGFEPPAAERSLLSKINSEDGQLSIAMTSLFARDTAGTYADNQVESDQAGELQGTAGDLLSITQSNAANLITQNKASFLDSQHLFIGVAAGSVVLALLLGVILSWALVEPIRQVRARLKAIAAGDFSGHVDVVNRDELGDLAVDLNRMSSELGRLYHELENASRHKSEFLANMSHELRTPLNAVIGFSEVLRDRLFGDLNDKQAEYVADIHSSGRHLLALINDILDLSKIEAGRMDLRITPFALSEIVHNSVTLSRERATREGIALSVEVDPGIGVIEADERMLKQVLFNLLSNALKFTPKGGHVGVGALADGDDVVVSVRDDGVGIAAADHARIFEEFQQVGTSHLQEGTGLGLAISRRFIELHGGSLRVESEPAHGSTFTLTLPRTQGAAIPPDREAPSRAEVAATAAQTTAPLA